jgi:hypothetical protein
LKPDHWRKQADSGDESVDHYEQELAKAAQFLASEDSTGSNRKTNTKRIFPRLHSAVFENPKRIREDQKLQEYRRNRSM